MKILLVNPPSPYLDNDAALYPPMGVLYIASSFEKRDGDVKILDMACENKSSLAHHLNLIGFTCVTPNVNRVKQLIQEVSSGHIVMVGGAHPTFMPSEQFGAHIVVQGEIESITHQILNDIKTKKFNKSYFGGLAKSDTICKPARHLVQIFIITDQEVNKQPPFIHLEDPFRTVRFAAKLLKIHIVEFIQCRWPKKLMNA